MVGTHLLAINFLDVIFNSVIWVLVRSKVSSCCGKHYLFRIRYNNCDSVNLTLVGVLSQKLELARIFGFVYQWHTCF